MKSLLMATLMAFAAGASHAECASYYCQEAQILSLYTTAVGDVYVRISGTTANLDCTLLEGVFLTLPASSPRFKEIYASMLATQLAERTMTFRIDIGSNGCTISYITTP
jgi:hypothetical protein